MSGIDPTDCWIRSPLAQDALVADRYRVFAVCAETRSTWYYLVTLEAAPVVQLVLRLLKPDLHQDPQAVQAFQDEAWFCSAADSQNLIRGHGAGSTREGWCYYVHEPLHGTSMLERFSGAEINDIQEIERYARAVTRVFADVHKTHRVFGVLSPWSVWSRAEGDWTSYADVILSSVGIPAANPVLDLMYRDERALPWIAPELGDGSRGSVSSDVYNLGMLLSFMVLGHTPQSPLRREQFLETRRPTALCLMPVLLKACSPNPADRHVSAEELELAISERCSVATRLRSQQQSGTRESGFFRFETEPQRNAKPTSTVVFASRLEDVSYPRAVQPPQERFLDTREEDRPLSFSEPLEGDSLDPLSPHAHWP